MKNANPLNASIKKLAKAKCALENLIIVDVLGRIERRRRSLRAAYPIRNTI